MPKFLEHKLENEARAKHLTGRKEAAYVYGTMNNLGAMHGSEETAKGREMEAKHQEDTKMAKHEPMREMRIEIHRAGAKGGKGGKVTGFTVHHHMVPKASKSPAFYEDTTAAHPFSADEHGKMMDHVAEHLKGQVGGGKAGAGDNEAMDNAEEAVEEEAE